MTEVSLIERLGDLAAVEPAALVAGLAEGERQALLRAFVADLEHTLGEARERAAELAAQVKAGAEPLAWMAWPRQRRMGDDGGRAARAGADALRQRAAACRELALVCEGIARVSPRLVEADRVALLE